MVSLQKIKEMVESGFANKRIANVLNIPEKELKKIITENNFALTHEKFDNILIPKIIELYSSGVSAKQLGKKYGIAKSRVQKWADNEGVLRSKQEAMRFTFFNENIFDEIDSEEKSYWLGFFYADAYNSESTNTFRIALQKRDTNHLIKLAKFIGLPENKVESDPDDSIYPSSLLRIYSKHFCQNMKDKGCMQGKSFIIKFPTWIDKKYYNSFIRGYFDGDGCLTYRKNQREWKWLLVSTNEMCEFIKNYFDNSFGIKLTKEYISNTNNNTYEIVTSGNAKIQKICDILYKNSNIYLDRKYQKYLDLCEFNNQIEKRQSYFKIVEINDIKITDSYVSSLDYEQRENLVEPIFHYFRQQGWLYPDYTEERLKKEYETLVNYKIDTSLSELNNNNSIATRVCKYFCKTFYSSCEGGNKPMTSLWEDDDVLKKLIRNRLGLHCYEKDKNYTFNINHRCMVEGFRDSRIGSMVSIFKPNIAKYICEKYSEPGDLVGDYSCGFGGRLLGAMSCGRKYIGTDPLTVPELQKMVDFFDFKDCILIQSGSEDYKGEENSVDLYWSSPPYFMQEIYSYDQSQCYIKGEKYFYETYWKKTLENVKFMLKPGKWFGLNIKYDSRMINMAKSVFGDIVEQVGLTIAKAPTTIQNGNKIKHEYIYMFKNIK